jgi:transketolase
VATSHELFRRQPAEVQEELLPWKQWQDSTVFASGARRLMSDWLANKVAEEYAVTPDWDDRWRTGGSVEEIVAESHLDPAALREAIQRFAREREERLSRIRDV